MFMPIRARIGLTIALCALCAAPASAGQPLETETARMLPRGAFEFEAGFERQTSSGGTESAIPLALEYGLSNRFSLLIEPVPWTRIHDNGIGTATGIGDIEMTLTTLLAREAAGRPAFALGTEVKIPTSKNIRIGSGKTDVAFYLIGSKRYSRWDTHANLSYTIVGKPAGVAVKNVGGFALAGEYKASPRVDLVSEVFGSTAARSDSTENQPVTPGSALTPEIGGSELVGTLGVRFHPAGSLTWSLGVSYDSNQALLLHPGISARW